MALSQGKGIADILAALITGKVEGKQMTKTKTGKLAQMDSEHIALLKIISWEKASEKQLHGKHGMGEKVPWKLSNHSLEFCP